MLTWLWLGLTLLPLILLERWIHKHLQGIGLLLFRDADLALVVYSLIMLPGVIAHEGSHWLMAGLLGVPTGRFSVVPARMPDGTLRLGYVETRKVDLVREALIGVAPILGGTTLIILIGYWLLGVDPIGTALSQGDLLSAWQGVQQMSRAPDFWVWVYLIFTISNSMLPSASDRRAWWPLTIIVLGVVGLLFYAGLGMVLVANFAQPVELAVRALASAFTITISLNVCLMPGLWLIEKIIIGLTGMEVKY